jgi:2-methylcitrate dehydratase PrpD
MTTGGLHPSSVVLPVVLALGEQAHISGRAFLDAFLAGFEVEARVGNVINPRHFYQGWHPTGTIGPLGAAAAAARLIGLTRDQARVALAIAACSGGAMRKNIGSHTKPLEAGKAAFHGIQAAEFARLGVTGDASVMDGPGSYVEVFGGEGDHAGLLAAFDAPWPKVFIEQGIGQKRFAACGFTHHLLDALLEIIQKEPFQVENVVRIEARVTPWIAEALSHTNKVTQDPQEGKFSIPYCLAVLLLDHAAALAQFTPSRARDPRLLEFMKKVEVVVDPSPAQHHWLSVPGVVTVELSDGRQLTAEAHGAPKGWAENPLSEDDLLEKANACCVPVLGREQSDVLVELARGIADCPDVGALARAAAPI